MVDLARAKALLEERKADEAKRENLRARFRALDAKIRDSAPKSTGELGSDITQRRTSGGVLGLGRGTGTDRFTPMDDERKAQAQRDDVLGNLSLKLAGARGRPEVERAMVEESIPDAVFEQDGEGATLVSSEALGITRQAINEAGLSRRDIDQTVATGLAFAPLGGVGGATLAGRMVGTGALAAGEVVAQDVALASQYGTDIELGDAAIAGIFGFGLQGLADPIISGVVRRIRASGDIDAKAIQDLKAAGVDTDSLTEDQWNKVRQAAVDNPAQIQDASSMGLQQEFGIPMTAANRTGDQRLAAREQALRDKDPEGFEEFDAKRFQAQQGSVGIVQNEIAPQGVPLTNEINEAGNVVQDGLRRAYEDARKAVNDAYDAVDGEATFIGNGLKEHFEGIEGRLAGIGKRVDMADIPGTESATPFAKRSIRILQQQVKEIADLGGEVTVDAIQSLRRQLSDWRAETKPGKADRGAMNAVIADFDGYIETMTDKLLISGDPLALQQLQKARAMRADVGRKFERDTFNRGSDEGGKVLEKIVDQNLSGYEVMNEIIGQAQLSNRKYAQAAVDKLKEAVGTDSDAWQALREGALQKMMRPPASGGFDPKTYLKNWNNIAQGRGKEVFETLFTVEERQMLARHREALARSMPENLMSTRAGLNRLEDTLNAVLDRGIKKQAGAAQFKPDAFSALRSLMIAQIPQLRARLGTNKVINPGKITKAQTPLSAAVVASGVAAGNVASGGDSEAMQSVRNWLGQDPE